MTHQSQILHRDFDFVASARDGWADGVLGSAPTTAALSALGALLAALPRNEADAWSLRPFYDDISVRGEREDVPDCPADTIAIFDIARNGRVSLYICAAAGAPIEINHLDPHEAADLIRAAFAPEESTEAVAR